MSTGRSRVEITVTRRRDKANRMVDAGQPLRQLTWRNLTVDRAVTSRRILRAYEQARRSVVL